MTGIRILSTGKCVPSKVVTNDDLSKIVDTSDQWIKQRTGMQIRRHVTDEEGTTFLATNAAKEAIEKSGLAAEDIGVVVVATLSADNFAPSTAALLQKNLGLKKEIIAFDLNAACSGFIFGLETVRGLLMSTKAKAALLVGVESLSKKLDMTDRGTCVLFGDGAAACVITLRENTVYRTITGVQSDDKMITCKVPDGKITMDGQGTYKFAVATVPGLIADTISKAGLTPDDVDYYVLHQANLRIIESIAAKLNQPIEKFVVNIEKYGNTSAASVGLALDEAVKAGTFRSGDKILICAFGAGKTYGATVIEW